MAGRLTRGDIVIASAPGEYGKPRPSVVVQSDLLMVDSIVVCPMTSDLIDSPTFRPTIHPSEINGLRVRSQVMSDKIVGLPLRKIGRRVGQLSSGDMDSVDRALVATLGLAGTFFPAE